MFPDAEMFGIDLVIPDITYLREHRENLRAFVITMPTRITWGASRTSCRSSPGVPIYASTLARGLLGNKIKEHKLHNNPMLALEPGDRVTIGAFEVEAFRIGHSIPDAMGWLSRSPAGASSSTTGDFKFDHTPVDGKPSDFQTLARYGEEGVSRCSPTRRAPRNPGYTPSERTVGEAFREIMEGLDVGSSSPPSPATSPASSRCSDAAATFDRRVAVIGPLHGAELPDRQ